MCSVPDRDMPPTSLVAMTAITVAGVVGVGVVMFASGEFGFFIAVLSLVLAVVVVRRLARRNRP
jgi:hypothetical protein